MSSVSGEHVHIVRCVVAPEAVINDSRFILCFWISLAINNEREGKLLLSSYSVRSENGSAMSSVTGLVVGVYVVPIPVQPPVPVEGDQVVDVVIDPPVVVIPDDAPAYTPR